MPEAEPQTMPEAEPETMPEAEPQTMNVFESAGCRSSRRQAARQSPFSLIMSHGSFPCFCLCLGLARHGKGERNHLAG